MQAEERKQQIIQAAIKVFSLYGYEKSSIAIVCAEATIARGTLYQYFKNKRTLFREIIESYSKLIKEFMHPMDLSKADCIPPSEFLYHRYYMIFEAVYNNKNIFKVLLREAVSKSSETADLIIKMDKSFINLIQEEVSIGIRAGIYQPVDAEFVGVWTYYGIRGIIENYIIDQEKPISLDTLAKMAMRMSIAFLLYPGPNQKISGPVSD